MRNVVLSVVVALVLWPVGGASAQPEARPISQEVAEAAVRAASQVAVQMATARGGAQAAPAAARVTGQAPEPLTFRGTTDINTDLFQLTRNAYRVTWEVTPESDGDCVFYADLRTPNGRRAHRLASPDVAVTRAAETNIYGVRPGAYFLDVSTTCPAWRVTLTPR